MLIKGRGGTRETLILEPVRVAAIVELESGSFEKYLKSTGGLGVFLSIFRFSKFGNVCEGVILEGLLVILNLDEQRVPVCSTLDQVRSGPNGFIDRLVVNHPIEVLAADNCAVWAEVLSLASVTLVL